MSKLSRWVLCGLMIWASHGYLAENIANAADLSFAPVTGQLSSPFGWRSDPMTGGHRFHGGIDIAAPSGMPVYAPQAGRVTFSGTHGGYGKVVVLDHGNSLYTLYGHNSELLVRPGDAVYRGQQLAKVGSTGRSTGPHLHFEVHYNRQYLNPLVYLGYLQKASPMLAQGSPATVAPAVSGERASGSSARRVVQRTPKGKTVQLLTGNKVENLRF